MMKTKAIAISLISSAILLSPFAKTFAAVQTSVTRSQAEQRALNIINLKWTYSSSLNGVKPSSYASVITQPTQLKNVSNAVMTGIPYDWGALDSLDSSSYSAPWTNFLTAISNGAFAGNVNTSSPYGYIGGTAGIDCSGFVQSVFNINDYKLSTSTMFNQYFTKINLSDLKHMDILDKPGDHVVIFDSWGSQNGVQGAFTYEATPDQTYGGIQGTKKYFISINEINSGYIPGRYVNIIEDSTVYTNSYGKVSNVTYSANFRANPSTSAEIIGTIPKDTILNLISYSSGWYKVTYNNEIGWIYGNLITSIPTNKYVKVNNVYQLNIRTSPSSSSSIIGVLGENQYAEVLGTSTDGNWYKISVNGIQGYAYAQYLTYIQ